MGCMAYNDTSVSDVPSPTDCDATQYQTPMCMNDSGDVWTPGPAAHDPSMRIMCGDEDPSVFYQEQEANDDGKMKDLSSAPPSFRYGAITGISSSTVVALATYSL